MRHRPVSAHVALQGMLAAGDDHYAFELKARAKLQGLIVAPRPILAWEDRAVLAVVGQNRVDVV